MPDTGYQGESNFKTEIYGRGKGIFYALERPSGKFQPDCKSCQEQGTTITFCNFGASGNYENVVFKILSEMIAKAKAISHGKEAINYVLREGKLGYIIMSKLLESREPESILKEFEMIHQHSNRCKNKYLRFEIGIAPQDEKNLTKDDLITICQTFAKYMGLGDHQWFACTHKDTDNLHIHLIANRISIGGNVYNTDFISNRASKLTEKISKKMGLTIANDVYKEKEFQKQKTSPERLQIKTRLQNIAYGELRRKHPDIESFLKSLKQMDVGIEFTKNKQGKVYGLRFEYEGQTFKASEIGKEFGLRSLYNHFGLQLNGQSSQAKHLVPKPEPQATSAQSLDTGISSIIYVLSPEVNN